MRKIIILSILLALGLFLGAEELNIAAEEQPIATEEQDIPKFGLVYSDEYNIDLRVSGEMQRVYVVAEFLVCPAKMVAADYNSFFLNKVARIEQVFINNQLTSPVLATGLVPEHFEPVFPIPELLSDSTFATCYSFKLEPLKASPELIKVKLRYWLPITSFNTMPNEKCYVEFPLEKFWFPRNVEKPSAVNLKMVSSSRYALDIGSEVTVTDNNGIITHSVRYTDEPGKTLSIKIIKS